jgi:hypothetical protein
MDRGLDPSTAAVFVLHRINLPTLTSWRIEMEIIMDGIKMGDKPAHWSDDEWRRHQIQVILEQRRRVDKALAKLKKKGRGR